MARLARVIAVDVPHHVTQRGNARRYMLDSDADRTVYLSLLREHAAHHDLAVMAYCLMSNHVHLIVVPHRAEALAMALKHTHGRYASYWNAKHTSSGHLWQGRFYSCPLDWPHLWAAMRYTELNPVRARLVDKPGGWRWSSAGAHCGSAEPDACLEMGTWRQHWSPDEWRAFLAERETEAELATIRQCTHTGRPLGSEEFIKSLEQATRRRLAPHTGGRLQKPSDGGSQKRLVFEP